MQGEKRILVVNDEREMSKQIKRWLDNAGYGVKCTVTAERALELFRNDNFDLILLDFNLKKEKNGAKTAKTFIPLFKDINPLVPIILISATEPNLVKETFDVAAVFNVRSSIWKNLPLIVNQVLKE